jgi:hypothetical protein
VEKKNVKEKQKRKRKTLTFIASNSKNSKLRVAYSQNSINANNSKIS